MTAIVAFMALFYVTGDPYDPVEEEAVIVSNPVREMLEVNSEEITPEVNLEATFPSPAEEESTIEEVNTPDSEPTEGELLKTAEALATPVKEKGFTPWMEPLALDTYIRSKSTATGKTFWESGHWITAVEGRWKSGTREFRIAYDQIPGIETWQWRYKVNQSQSEFATSVSEMVDQGYTLVQTQTFRQPDGDHRYQGVWHRQLASPTVADTRNVQSVVKDYIAPAQQPNLAPISGSTATVSTESRGLNVNRLSFR